MGRSWWMSVGIACLAGGAALAQQITPPQNTQQGASSGLTVQGPQLITGEELRASRQPGELVGGAGQGVGNLRSQTGAAGPAPAQGAARFGGPARGGLGQFNPFNPFNSMYNQGLFNSMYNQRAQFRTPLQLGFAPHERPGGNHTAVRIERRLTKIPQLHGMGKVRVQMDGRVVVLRGEVASKHQRDLIGRLVLLEPGVADVRNELQVAKPPAGP